jgi:L-ascorbate metabolism protein UlaG (beta-lactamase superfamily)
MGYEDAAIAANWLNVNKVIGMHYDTSPQIEIDHNEAKAVFAVNQKELILPVMGATFKM